MESKRIPNLKIPLGWELVPIEEQLGFAGNNYRLKSYDVSEKEPLWRYHLMNKPGCWPRNYVYCRPAFPSLRIQGLLESLDKQHAYTMLKVHAIKSAFSRSCCGGVK